VELIRQGGDRLQLVVISVGTEIMDDEIYSEEQMPNFRYDYTDKRSLPITIPNYQYVQTNGERFIVYNVNMAGRHLGSRRYSEFVQLNKQLKDEFPDFAFPKLPRKWPFRLSDQQIDSRRRMLENYLEKVCTVKVLADCDLMQVNVGLFSFIANLNF
jgi:sorting nexin-27